MSRLAILKSVAFMTDEVKLAEIQKIIDNTETPEGEVKLEEMKLEDGVTVIMAEKFEAGYPVFVINEAGEQIPLPAGEYTMEDGYTLVVEPEGMIKEIIAAGSEPEGEPAPAEEPVAAADSPTEKPALPKSIIESISKETRFSKEELMELSTVLKTLLEEEKPVEEEVELAKPIVYNPENRVEKEVALVQQNRAYDTMDRIMAGVVELTKNKK